MLLHQRVSREHEIALGQFEQLHRTLIAGLHSFGGGNLSLVEKLVRGLSNEIQVLEVICPAAINGKAVMDLNVIATWYLPEEAM